MKETNSTKNEVNDVVTFEDGFLRTAGGSHVLPTTIRKLVNKEYNVDFLNKGEKIKYFLGVGVGALANLVYAVGYPFAALNCEVPEFLYICERFFFRGFLLD